MCCGCWEDGGSPTIWNAKVGDFWSKWHDDWEAFTPHAHCVLDDDNVDDCDIEWALADLRAAPQSTDVRRDLAIIIELAALSEAERYSIVGLANGCWAPALSVKP